MVGKVSGWRSVTLARHVRSRVVSPALPRSERERLVRLIQYLNLAEMKAFCQQHELPLHIHVQCPDGSLRRTGDRDRKDVVLARILAFALRARRTGPTIYRAAIVANAPLSARLSDRTRLFYNQYEKHNPRFLAAMARLTAGVFRTGMIARLVLRDFWTAGTAPTLRQFAGAWERARAAHTRPRPEGAYLVDRWRGEGGPGWKRVRVENARAALAMLRELCRG